MLRTRVPKLISENQFVEHVVKHMFEQCVEDVLLPFHIALVASKGDLRLPLFGMFVVFVWENVNN